MKRARAHVSIDVGSLLILWAAAGVIAALA